MDDQNALEDALTHIELQTTSQRPRCQEEGTNDWDHGEAPTFESVLQELGTHGRFQITQVAIVSLGIAIGCHTALGFVFTGYEPPHICTTVNETKIFNAFGTENDSSAFISYDPCELKVLTNRSGFVEKITEMTCPSGRNFSDGSHASILSEFDLVCESAGIGETVAFLGALGQIIGSVIGASLSDRFGRRSVVLAASLPVFVIEASTIFAPNFLAICLLRFLSGVFVSAMTCAGPVLTIEILTPKERTFFSIIGSFLWTFWTLSIGALAYATRDYGWRGYQATGALLAAVFPLYFYFVRESPRWLSVNNKPQKGLDVLKFASKQNKKDFGRVKSIYLKYVMKASHSKAMHEEKSSTTIIDENNVKVTEGKYCGGLFQKRIMLLILVSSFLWLTHELLYYGMFLMSSTFSGDRFLNYILMALTEIPSNFVQIAVMLYFGRRNIIAIFLGLASVSLLVCSLMATFAFNTSSYGTVSLIFFMVGKFAVTSSFNVFFLLVSETFPTYIRTLGIGLSISLGRSGSLLAPYLRPLYGIAVWAPAVLFCTMCVISLMLIPVLPEMKDVNLQDTAKQIIGVNKKKSSSDDKCCN